MRPTEDLQELIKLLKLNNERVDKLESEHAATCLKFKSVERKLVEVQHELENLKRKCSNEATQIATVFG